MQQRVMSNPVTVPNVDLTNDKLRSVILDLLSGKHIAGVAHSHNVDPQLMLSALRFTGRFKPSSRRYIFEDNNPAGLSINRVDLLATGSKPFGWNVDSYWLSKEVKSVDELELG